MEIKIIKESKNELEFELIGEDHTFCNALRHILNKHKDVIFASYKVEHPLLSNPKIYIKTKDKPLPKKAERIVPLTEVKGIGPKVEKKLKDGGIDTANALLKADVTALSEKTGITEKMLEKYIKEAKKLDYTKDTIPRIILKEALKDLQRVVSEAKVNAQA
jgi:DNA-directed RNA polymerase subunit L